MYKIFISRLTLCYAVALIGVGIVLDFVLLRIRPGNPPLILSKGEAKKVLRQNCLEF